MTSYYYRPTLNDSDVVFIERGLDLLEGELRGKNQIFLADSLTKLREKLVENSTLRSSNNFGINPLPPIGGPSSMALRSNRRQSLPGGAAQDEQYDDSTPEQTIDLVMDQFQILYEKAAADAGWVDTPPVVDEAMAEAYRILRSALGVDADHP